MPRRFDRPLPLSLGIGACPLRSDRPGVEAAALHDEVRDDPVEYRAVIEAVTHVTQEVLGGERCTHRVQFQHEGALRRLDPDARRERTGCLGARHGGQQGNQQDGGAVSAWMDSFGGY